MSDYQRLYFEGLYELDDNNQLTVELKYQSNDPTTTGIGLGIRYDSTSMQLDAVTQNLTAGSVATISNTPTNSDDEESVLHNAAYSDPFGPGWPNVDASDGVSLYTLTFSAVEGGNTNYEILLESVSGMTGFDRLLEDHVPPTPLVVNEQSVDENLLAGQVVASVEGGPNNAVYTLEDQTDYGESSSGATEIVIPEVQPNVQHVYVSERNYSDDGSQVTIKVAYASQDDTLTGLGIKLHFDSSKLSLAEITDLLQTGKVNTPTIESITDDANDGDGDASTDKVLTMAWSDAFGGSWPGATSTDLVTLTFDIEDDATETDINFSSTSTASGYVLDGQSFTVAKPPLPPLTIDESTGEITLNEVADYETISEYSYEVSATAGDTVETVTGVVTVNNMDEVAPTLTSASSAAVDENASSVIIYTATADDSADASDGVLFSLGSGSDSDLSIDEDSGDVTLTFSRDYEIESQREISFSVIATDLAGNASTEQSVTITVNNLDEVAPTITSSSSTNMIDENSGAGQVIYTATADDSMDVSNGVTFSLSDDGMGAVSIDASTGDVTFIGNPDYESDSMVSFSVVATDAAGNSSFPEYVTLDLINLDDSAPIHMYGSEVSLTDGNGGIEETHSNDESNYMSQVVYTADAYDDSSDVTSGVSYFSISDDHGGIFSIDSMTGDVSLDVAPDYEDVNLALNDDMGDKYFSFTITVEDFAGNTAEQSVKLYVKDVAELPPVFRDSVDTEISAADLDIDENNDSPVVVYTANAVAHPAVVAENDDSIVYSLDDADNTWDFSIDSTTGEVSFAVTTDHEMQSSYSFIVLATDVLGNVNQLPVTLTVNDLDEVAPTITSDMVADSIDENDDAQVIYTATADDSADISGGVTFSLGEGSDSALSIDSISGEVSIDVSADHEVQSVYSFSVIATDAADNVSSEQSVSLDINDLDDTAATITSGDSADAINENTGAGQVIYTAIADDSADVSDGVTFSLADGSDAGLSIDSVSGDVTLAADPDFESQDQYSFTVVATDAAGNEVEQAVTLDINDLDEIAPTITSSDTADAIDENNDSMVIYTATADDSADISAGVTFTLGAGSDAALSIDTTSGEVSIDVSADHETQTVYSFSVIATDGAGNSSQQAVTLDINDIDDTAPEITSPDSASVLESASENVAVYQAIVDDTADVNDGVINYSLAGDDAASFAVNSLGLVTLLDDPDTSLQATYNFDVVATDSAGNFSSKTVKLTVVDQDLSGPVFTSETSAAIDENSGAAQVVYIATSQDESPVSYSFTAGSDQALDIDEDSGEVTLAVNPDAEVQSQYNFTVVATDESGNDTEQSVILTISDLDELAPTITSASSADSVDENSAVGTVIYTAASNDSHNIVQQGAISQNFVDNGDNTFTVQFFVDASVANDYAAGIEGFGFDVSFTSDGSELSVEHVEYSSNDLYAIHNQVNNTISYTAAYFEENSVFQGAEGLYEVSAGLPILEVTFNASDASQTNTITVSNTSIKAADSAHSTYYYDQDNDQVAVSSYSVADANNGVKYSLADGSDSGLLIDEDTGAVSLSEVPDAEVKSEYSFTVVATDAAGNQSDTQSVTLDVNNLDEVAATITSGAVAAAIDENSNAGQVVYIATADDSVDVSGGVAFSLAEGSDTALSIDASTGEVTLSDNPDAEIQAQYSFSVIATDAAGNESAAQSVTLDINDLDDAAATITSDSIAEAIDENSGAGQVIYTATADDSADVTDGVTFSLAEGSDAALSINASTGEVTLSDNPDAETQAQYSFSVIATDFAGNKSAAQSVTLDINNLDDTAATITSGATATAIDENTGAGQVVYTATADDSADVTGGVSFSLSGADSAAFTIDASSGEVALIADTNADEQDQYSFTVIATDLAGNASSQTVTLDINNLDEVAPVITSGSVVVSIDENSGAYQQVYTATADDSLDVSGGISFSLTEQSNSALSIDAETGVVTLAPNPYAHIEDSYQFTVVATDAAGNASAKNLQLEINDLHETSVTYYSNNIEVTDFQTNTNGDISKSYAGDAKVDVGDVIAALRLSVGLSASGGTDTDSSSNAMSIKAADIVDTSSPFDNSDNNPISGADVLALLYSSVGLDYVDVNGNTHSVNPEWKFEEVSSDEISTNHVGYIVGDVDGSWSPSGEADPVIIISEATMATDVIFTINPSKQEVSATPDLEIDDQTGAITFKADSIFDGVTEFTVSNISGNDSGQRYVVEIAQQDNTDPVFESNSEVSVLESEDLSHVVYVAVADDSADVSAGLTYSLVNNGIGNLTINGDTGEVSLAGALIVDDVYNFTVTASDAAGNSAEQAVKLSVDKIPDTTSPVFTSGDLADVIDEGSGENQVVYTANTDDESNVTYSLAGTDAAAFSIGENSGVVTLTANPDAETKADYSFTVVATDAANNTSSQSVTLDINNIDEIAPTFTSGNTASNIDENSGAGTVIYTATADDSLDVSEGLSFELATNSDPALSINPETGEVTLASNADFEFQTTYSFTVLLTDYVNATVTQTVTLDINNLDDTAPTIDSGATATAIDENTGAGQVVYTASADDTQDISAGVTFSLAGADAAAFTIDASSGEVTLTANPDADTKAQYSFSVVATDAANNVSNAQLVTLDINNLDDTAPTITSGDIATAIDENSGAGQLVYTASADDSADLSDGVIFSLAGDDAAAFTIDATSGEVTIIADPDADAQDQYSFTVIATDAAENVSSQSVTLDINDLDDADPIITSGDTADSIDENSGAGQVVYTVAAYDNADVTDGVTFNLLPGSDPALTINSVTGEVSLDVDPDAEQQNVYSFDVQAVDAAGNSSDVQSVTLDINNLDDTSAVITSGATAPAINENSGLNQVIYTAVADDSADVSGGVYFSLTPDSDSSVSIDSATGEVTLLSNPDAELVNQYSFTVVVTDDDGNVSEQPVTLDINNLDEVAPTIDSGATATAIDENSGAGQVVYTASADDSADVSDGVTFSLAGADAAAFTVDANSRAVTLTANPDADTKSQYSFSVVATDAANNVSDAQSVTLDINNLDDTAPTIDSGSTATAIDENSGAGQVVYTASADDSADVSDGVTFSLAGDDAAAFTIDASTGEVSLTANPNTETQAQYSFSVVATDVAGNASSQTVTLDINNLDDTAPTIDSGATATAIDENSGAGQVVYTASADDSADVSDGVSFSLAGADAAAFTIDASSGEVTLTANPDADTKAQYSFSVVATDAANNVSNAQLVTLDINNLDDTAPTIDSGATATAIDENSGSGQLVYTASADDSADVSDGVTFSLAGDDAAAFAIDASSGAVTLIANPDAEAQSQYSFSVVASDTAGNASSQAVTLDINNVDDSAPAITSGDMASTIAENSGAGQVIYTATADDSGDISDGVTFSLSALSDPALSINATSGEVTLATNPDSEDQSYYSFKVIATDLAGNSSSEHVSLMVSDLDEVAPSITSGDTAVAVDENSGAGQLVYTASADDSADVSDGVTFSLAGDDAAAFTIDASSGEVTLTANPNADTQAQYNFSVIATDAATNVSDAQSVTLDINNLDDTAPIVDSGSTATTIDENSGAGQVVYTASADDSADVSDGVTFSLAGDDAAAFSIDASSGEVVLIADPDFEAQNQYSFSVVATDAAGNESDAQSVTLDIDNLDDTAPAIISGDIATAIDENSNPNGDKVVYTASADDSADVSDGVTFSLSGADAASFAIDANSGDVTLTADPNAEVQSQYSFSIVASDAAGNTSSQAVTLDINDIDDSAPTITSTDTVIVVEGEEAGQTVYQVTADDSGDNIQSGVTYSLKSDASFVAASVGEIQDNTQVAYVSNVEQSGDSVSVTVSYDADKPDLPGLGLRVHFDGSQFDVDSLVDVLGQDLIFTDADISLDTDNFDGNADTDSFVQVGWASLDGNWTSEIPKELLTVNFDLADSASGSAAIGFSSSGTPIGYSFEGNDAVVSFSSSDLSIDSSNGKVTLNVAADHSVQSEYDFTVVAEDGAGQSDEKQVKLLIAEMVANTSSSEILGAIEQQIIQKSDGSMTLQLLVSDELASSYQNGTGNIDLVLGYNPDAIGVIDGSQLSSPSDPTFAITNHIQGGELSVAQIYFPASENLQIGEVFLELDFNLENGFSSADFDISGVIVDVDDVDSSSSQHSVEAYNGSNGDDVYALVDGLADVNSGDGSDTFIITEDADANILVDFETGVDTLEMGLLLDSAGYTGLSSSADAVNGLAHQLSGDTPNIADLISNADDSLDNAFGGYLDDTTNVLTVFADMSADADMVDLKTMEVTLDEGSTMDDEDVVATLSAFIA